MKSRLAGSAVAASLLLAAPLAAQTSAPTTTNGVPPRTTDTKPVPKVTPEQVIGVVKGLLAPKPKPTPTPPPPPPPPPSPTPTATATVSPRPTPTPAPTVRPSSRPTPVTNPPKAPPTVAAPVLIESTPVAVDAADPAPLETVIAAPAPEPAPPAPEPGSPLWPWIVAALAALGLGEFGRRWFWPKAALGCEIAVGPSAVTGSSSPALTKPEISFDIRIEPGEASAPIGRPVLAQGDDI